MQQRAWITSNAVLGPTAHRGLGGVGAPWSFVRASGSRAAGRRSASFGFGQRKETPWGMLCPKPAVSACSRFRPVPALTPAATDDVDEVEALHHLAEPLAFPAQQVIGRDRVAGSAPRRDHRFGAMSSTAPGHGQVGGRGTLIPLLPDCSSVRANTTAAAASAAKDSDFVPSRTYSSPSQRARRCGFAASRPVRFGQSDADDLTRESSAPTTRPVPGWRSPEHLGRGPDLQVGDGSRLG